ncbi:MULTISPECIES: TonB family protein [Gammaproteobacteria]|uniref:TonB family protein n=1 Tax=Gammaproteobacteria TaxID=1236 RepID=UPI000DD0CC7E|nr:MULTISPECIES: TonB family protein [Gammaproteobacteria]RTE86916.1 energy transducer TonB [Aliidiomarina sp. B3213]TCZ93294.1 energy transducer TonB [Lysobacter sp. N42]
MKKSILTLVAAVTLAACQSTSDMSQDSNSASANNDAYTAMEMTPRELLKSKWGDLLRFPARYPEQAAMRSVNGCATVEYVITPENEVTHIQIVAESARYFGQAAEDVIQNWAWQQLPQGIISEPVKTQTRFDFCVESDEQPCSRVTQTFTCPGEDIIQSIGRRVM